MSSLSLETSESDDILHRKTTMNGEARVPDGTETAKKKFIIRLLTEFHKSDQGRQNKNRKHFLVSRIKHIIYKYGYS